MKEYIAEYIVPVVPADGKGKNLKFDFMNAKWLIRCKDCIFYDPPHIENDGQRYEYKDMPPEAFDPITKKYVSVAYGINMGGRCCRDYECGYSEDKRVFVTETNYCGRAERRGEE